MNGDFKVVELVVIDWGLLLVHNLLDFAIKILNLIFFGLDLLNKIMNLLQTSIRIGVLDAFSEIGLVLFILDVPLLLLLSKSRFEYITLQLGFI